MENEIMNNVEELNTNGNMENKDNSSMGIGLVIGSVLTAAVCGMYKLGKKIYNDRKLKNEFHEINGEFENNLIIDSNEEEESED